MSHIWDLTWGVVVIAAEREGAGGLFNVTVPLDHAGLYYVQVVVLAVVHALALLHDSGDRLSVFFDVAHDHVGLRALAMARHLRDDLERRLTVRR